jgi:hypothetical protein
MWIAPSYYPMSGTQMPMIGVIPPPMYTPMVCTQQPCAQQPPIRVPDEEPEESETEEIEPTTETEALMPNPIALANQLEDAAKEIRNTHFKKLASEMSFDSETLRDFEWEITQTERPSHIRRLPQYQIILKAVGDKSKLLLEQCRTGNWYALKKHLDMHPTIQKIKLSTVPANNSCLTCWMDDLANLCSLLAYVSPVKVSNLSEFREKIREQRDQQEQELALTDSCLEILEEQKTV